jgi:hypothetical protein
MPGYRVSAPFSDNIFIDQRIFYRINIPLFFMLTIISGVPVIFSKDQQQSKTIS